MSAILFRITCFVCVKDGVGVLKYEKMRNVINL